MGQNSIFLSGRVMIRTGARRMTGGANRWNGGIHVPPLILLFFRPFSLLSWNASEHARGRACSDTKTLVFGWVSGKDTFPGYICHTIRHGKCSYRILGEVMDARQFQKSCPRSSAPPCFGDALLHPAPLHLGSPCTAERGAGFGVSQVSGSPRLCGNDSATTETSFLFFIFYSPVFPLASIINR